MYMKIERFNLDDAMMKVSIISFACFIDNVSGHFFEDILVNKIEAVPINVAPYA